VKKCLLFLKQQQVYIGTVSIADNILTRIKGLLGAPPLPDYQGLLIKPCKQVHTVGMRYPISVWFIDKDNQVIRIINNLKPGKISPYIRTAQYIVEFSGNWAERCGCREGDYLEIRYI
jgi:uncharacterized membrane protein (UPF0127 family)